MMLIVALLIDLSNRAYKTNHQKSIDLMRGEKEEEGMRGRNTIFIK